MVVVCVFFLFKQKTAYEMRISDWSSDVCSSDLARGKAGRRCRDGPTPAAYGRSGPKGRGDSAPPPARDRRRSRHAISRAIARAASRRSPNRAPAARGQSSSPEAADRSPPPGRSEDAHVCTPVTNAHLVCRLLPEKKTLLQPDKKQHIQ